MGLSARQLAETLGVSHTAVNKAAARGRITRGPDGAFDPVTAKAQWDSNVNPHQQRRGLSGHPAPPVGVARPTPVPPPAAGEPVAAAGPLWEQPTSDLPTEAAQTATTVSVELERAKLKLRHEELKLGEYEKTLVNADEVRSAQEARANAEREALLNWPSRIAGELAAELGVDERTLYAALDLRIRNYLRDRSRTPIPEQGTSV